MCRIHIQHFGDISSTYGTYVSWGSMGTSCNIFYLKYKGLGVDAFITKSVSSSGSIFFPHDLDEYTFTYEVSCVNSRTCGECKFGETFVKKKNNDGVIGDYGDCQKEYLSYSIEPDPHYYLGFRLICNSPFHMIENTDDYLTVDYYRIYSTSHYGIGQIVQEGEIMPEVSVIYYPCNTMESFQIRFYSSRCISNEEHFIYGSYSWLNCGTGQGLSIPFLQEMPHY